MIGDSCLFIVFVETPRWGRLYESGVYLLAIFDVGVEGV